LALSVLGENHFFFFNLAIIGALFIVVRLVNRLIVAERRKQRCT